jgi:hypothetical protein
VDSKPPISCKRKKTSTCQPYVSVGFSEVQWVPEEIEGFIEFIELFLRVLEGSIELQTSEGFREIQNASEGFPEQVITVFW